MSFKENRKKKKTEPISTDFAVLTTNSPSDSTGIVIYHCTEDNFDQVMEILEELDSSIRSTRDAFLNLLIKYGVIEKTKELTTSSVFGVDC